MPPLKNDFVALPLLGEIRLLCGAGSVNDAPLTFWMINEPSTRFWFQSPPVIIAFCRLGTDLPRRLAGASFGKRDFPSHNTQLFPGGASFVQKTIVPIPKSDAN